MYQKKISIYSKKIYAYLKINQKGLSTILVALIITGVGEMDAKI